MRITASVGSTEYRTLWSLIPVGCSYYRSAALLLLAIAADPTLVDDFGSRAQAADQPTGGVTIRLELQPSAPESETSEPASEATTSEVPTSEAPTAMTPTVEKPAVEKPAFAASAAKTSAAKTPAAKTPASKISASKTSAALRPAENRHDKPAAVDRDFSNERTDSEQDLPRELELKPDDVPLEHEEHPYDAPAAKSDGGATESYRDAPVINRAELEASQFSQRELNIELGIQNCLNYYLTHPENTTRRGPWALMHALLPLGVESEVMAGSRRVNTIGWLCFNGTSGKQNMFQPTRTGFRPNVGPGVQGHEGQFLAMLAQSRVPGDYPLQINRRQYTVMDLAHYEMATCREKSELTFKLIGLSYYLEPNQQWRDNRGKLWSLEKMVAEELAQPINGAACGGVHRLMGLSYSLIERQAAGEAITGHWERSKIYINDYVNYTMSLQNPDGSFSTNWLESRGMDPKVERKVQTTGHILEWLVYTLPDDHLRSPRVLGAMEFLLNTVGRDPHKDWPIGPRGHALRAMSLYSQRVFGAQVGQLKSYVAQASIVGNSNLR